MKEHWKDLEPEEERFVTEFEAPLSALRARHAECPSPTLILAAQTETLPEDVAVRVTNHVRGCACCRLLSEDLTDRDLLRATPEIEGRIRARVFAGAVVAGRGPSRLPWRWLAPMAAAAVLILSVVTVYIARRPAPQTPAAKETAAKATDQKAGAGTADATPQRPSVFQLEKAPIRLPATAVMIWRGEEEADRESLMADLKTVLDSYRADDFADAARRLEATTAKHPTSADVYFYLGVSQLFLKRDAQAVDSLEKARQLASGFRTEEVAWYLGLAYQRVGRTALAAEALKRICGGSSPFAARACAGLDELNVSSGGQRGR